MARLRSPTALLLAVLVVSTASAAAISTASAITVDSPSDVVAVSSQVTVEPAAAGTRRVPASTDELAVSGDSNRETGHVVVVELRHPNGTIVRVTDTEVVNGTWNATLDIAGVEPGSYTISVSDGVVANSISLEIVVTPTPAETPVETPPPRAETPSEATATPTPTLTPTPMPLPSPVPTLAQSPGFGPGVALVAFVLTAAAFGWRRR